MYTNWKNSKWFILNRNHKSETSEQKIKKQKQQ